MSGETSQFPKPDLKRVSALINADSRQRYPVVTSERVTIGRETDNTVTLPDDTYVSGHHAQVFFEKGEWWVRDLGSRNGTMVNNLTISKPEKIHPGDVIVVGQSRLQVE